MIDFLRYNKYIRRILIKLTDFLPDVISDKIADFLFPDDCIVKFNEEQPNDRKAS